MTDLWQASRRSSAVLLLLALLLACTGSLAAEPRIVAVGDIHGDYDAFIAILREARIIDSNLHWIAGQDTLVQTGDMLDRGSKDRQVMDFLMGLQQEAAKSGGQVVVVLGNHEVMNMVGDLRYVTPDGYAQYATPKSEDLRKSAYREYVEWAQKRAKDLGRTMYVDSESKWMHDHPPGFLEQREQFCPQGKYGQWLRQLPAVVKIGTVLFLHGGISSPFSSESATTLSEHIHGELKSFDEYRKFMEDRKIILPFLTLAEMTQEARAELRIKGAANPEEQKVLSKFLEYGDWYSMREDGPTWFRGYSRWTDTEGEGKVPAILKQQGVEHVVVGHTPESDGQIHSRFGNSVFLIDTGMLSSYFGGQASALEIRSGNFTAVYPKKKVVLVESKAADAKKRVK